MDQDHPHRSTKERSPVNPIYYPQTWHRKSINLPPLVLNRISPRHWNHGLTGDGQPQPDTGVKTQPPPVKHGFLAVPDLDRDGASLHGPNEMPGLRMPVFECLEMGSRPLFGLGDDGAGRRRTLSTGRPGLQEDPDFIVDRYLAGSPAGASFSGKCQMQMSDASLEDGSLDHHHGISRYLPFLCHCCSCPLAPLEARSIGVEL